jgi:hypothetical protein
MLPSILEQVSVLVNDRIRFNAQGILFSNETTYFISNDCGKTANDFHKESLKVLLRHINAHIKQAIQIRIGKKLKCM